MMIGDDFKQMMVNAVKEFVTGPLGSQMELAQCNVLPDSKEMMYAIFAQSVGYNCGCISKKSEHWRKNPLHSYSLPE